MSKSKSMNMVGAQVRSIRLQQGLSQPRLAVKCQLPGWDLSREALAKIESQMRKVSDYEIILLAKALKVPFELLYPNRRKLARYLREFYG